MRLFTIPWDFVAILLVLAVIVPWRGAVRIRQLLSRPNIGTRERIALYASTIAFQWIAVAVTFWRATARGLTAVQLGLIIGRPTRTIAVAIGTAAFLAVVQWQGLRQLRHVTPDPKSRLMQFREKILPQNSTESLVFFALACTVAVCEELIYRGFVFAVVVLAAGGSLAIAILVSSAIFSAAHAYQGRQGIATTFVLGALFAFTRVCTLSLLPAIFAHLVVDLISGLSGARALRSSPATDSAAAGS
ncbi:MAG: type II CAAX endopeptidase family protein [Candidatus Acidiferrales bacterium]|jgi:membrane protease YdiL (CAAX protease family)